MCNVFLNTYIKITWKNNYIKTSICIKIKILEWFIFLFIDKKKKKNSIGCDDSKNPPLIKTFLILGI